MKTIPAGSVWSYWVLLALIFSFLGVEAFNISKCSVVVDENAHFVSGLSYFELGRFDLYNVNPPLTKLISAFPVWLANPMTNYRGVGVGLRSEFVVGPDFQIANAERYPRLLFLARLPVVFLAAACGGLIFLWARESSGDVAALICLSLWLFDPNVIAHGGVATTDMGASAFATLSIYTFWRWLCEPGFMRLCVAGVSLGLAIGSKFSLLIFMPIWLVLVIAWPFLNVPHPESWRARYYHIAWTPFAFSLSLFVVNSMYLYDGTLSKLDSFGFYSHVLGGVEKTSDFSSIETGNRFRGTILGVVPVPFPRLFMTGLDWQLFEEETSNFANLSGGKVTRGGNYFGPFVTLARKIPVGTLILILSACFSYPLLSLSAHLSLNISEFPSHLG